MIPAALAEIIDDFQALSRSDRLELLLDFSEALPELPERYGEHPELLERVPECQSPLFLTVEVDGSEGPARLFFSAPRESPTTRGFAGILREGLDGLPAREILDVADDMPQALGLAEAISPLRLRGMGAMLARIKLQVRRAIDAPA